MYNNQLKYIITILYSVTKGADMFKRIITPFSALLLCLLLTATPSFADTILDDFQVNTEFPGHPPQKSPYAVANWETERIYLTWLSKRDGVNWDVAFNRFDYDLEPLDDAIYLNEPLGSCDCMQPRLVLSAAGFGAAWIEDAGDGISRHR